MALKALNTLIKTNSETYSFLQTHKVPSASNSSSSELVPFAGRLCSSLAVHVSQINALFTESSPDDPNISALSRTLPGKSQHLPGTAVLEVLGEGFSLFNSPIMSRDTAFHDILIDYDFVPLLKSAIITCLDLLEHETTDSTRPPAGRADLLITIINCLWNCLATCLCDGRESHRPVVESAFSDVPQLCSLLDRTCRHSSPADFFHLRMIISVSYILPRLNPHLLEENLVQRVINTSKPMTIPTTQGKFHKGLIWSINNLIWDPRNITQDKDERKRIRQMQFERALKPAKQYLQFILQREEFIPNGDPHNKDFPHRIAQFYQNTMLLERELFQDGVNMETVGEEWEVGWLVEKTNERDLRERLSVIREDEETMRTNEKGRWKKRVERQREAGHEDVLEGWLKRRDNETPSEIVQYIKGVTQERGMNVRF
ncbi:hypothetical protein BLNAU_14951 [Blattamonas nauphoetae]|uniref:Uncharacterized protein n=1 Tax=Blattamonas nauphoetae TaxID=2049346 RepID=A0ABQ9XEM9_9EUKA|nr:hypothetical protein BLNAU_14951 [Blattamonas nauphoetae]